MKKRAKLNFVWVGLLLLATIWILTHKKEQVTVSAPYNSVIGLIFGTVYKVTYQYDGDLKEEIDTRLKQFDASLSPFNTESTISKINRNEEVVVDSFFRNCFERAMQVSQDTDGAFDITVGPLVNAWGFGFKQGQFPDAHMVDSLLQIIGYQKITLENGRVAKQDPRIMLNCSAIAKGYAVDVIAQYLNELEIQNYMVDIGGEVVTRGSNPQNARWRIGINKPINDSLSVSEELQTILNLTDVAVATSGNYRNYYYKDGKKYGHTIDPHTGYPVQHSILSATVLAKDCMTADAYATAFMVMGMEKAVGFLRSHPELEVYFIYGNEGGEYNVFSSEGMKKYLE